MRPKASSVCAVFEHYTREIRNARGDPGRRRTRRNIFTAIRNREREKSLRQVTTGRWAWPRRSPSRATKNGEPAVRVAHVHFTGLERRKSTVRLRTTERSRQRSH